MSEFTRASIRRLAVCNDTDSMSEDMYFWLDINDGSSDGLQFCFCMEHALELVGELYQLALDNHWDLIGSRPVEEHVICGDEDDEPAENQRLRGILAAPLLVAMGRAENVSGELVLLRLKATVAVDTVYKLAFDVPNVEHFLRCWIKALQDLGYAFTTTRFPIPWENIDPSHN